MDREKIVKMVVILAVIVVIASGLSKYLRRDSISLAEYARLHDIQETASPVPSGSPAEDTSLPPGSDEGDTGSSSLPSMPPDSDEGDAGSSSLPSMPPDSDEGNAGNSSLPSMPPGSDGDDNGNSSLPSPAPTLPPEQPNPDGPESTAQGSALLTGASLNGNTQQEQRVSLEEGFYYEPLSTQLCRYITGISFPATDETEAEPEITFEELRYVHILHYNFEGNPTEGELICNVSIAQDLVEIFHELYLNEYQLERVRLIDEYDGDDNASMENNNTSCFNYRPVEGSTRLSRHALGLAVDINPLYNPYITYTEEGEENVLPASAAAYADRSAGFPYKIDENDLCYKLFIQHGFTWGGNWNNVKDYQHFQKTK